MYIYIYNIPGTQMTSMFENRGPPKQGRNSNQNKGAPFGGRKPPKRHEITGWIWQATLGDPGSWSGSWSPTKLTVENQPFLKKYIKLYIYIIYRYIYKWWRKSIAM